MHQESTTNKTSTTSKCPDTCQRIASTAGQTL